MATIAPTDRSAIDSLTDWNNVHVGRISSEDGSYKGFMLRAKLPSASSVYESAYIGPDGKIDYNEDGLPFRLPSSQVGYDRAASAILTALFRDLDFDEDRIEAIANKFAGPLAEYIASQFYKDNWRIDLSVVARWVIDNELVTDVPPLYPELTLDEIIKHNEGVYLYAVEGGTGIGLAKLGRGERIQTIPNIEDWSLGNTSLRNYRRGSGYLIARELGFSAEQSIDWEFFLEHIYGDIPIGKGDRIVGVDIRKALELAKTKIDTRTTPTSPSRLNDITHSDLVDAGVYVVLPADPSRNGSRASALTGEQLHDFTAGKGIDVAGSR